MNAAAVPAVLACVVFGFGMLHAAVTDLIHQRIRNWMVAGLATAWAPLALVAGLPPAEMLAAAAAALAVFAAGFGCFAAGWLGGGDVKLAAITVLWLGAGQAVPFVLLASVVGAALTGLLLAIRRLIVRSTGGPAAAAAIAHPVPYGPALAAAGLILLGESPLTAAL